MTDARPARDTPVGGVWSPGRRSLTLGLVFTITLVGFEGLAVATILNVINDDLHDINLLGWVFSAFFLGSLFGVIAAGYDADRHGPARPFVIGLVLFALGLLGGGLAPNMVVLVCPRDAGHRRGRDPARSRTSRSARLPRGAAAAHVRSAVDGMGAPRTGGARPERRGRRRRSAGVGCSSASCRSSRWPRA